MFTRRNKTSRAGAARKSPLKALTLLGVLVVMAVYISIGNRQRAAPPVAVTSTQVPSRAVPGEPAVNPILAQIRPPAGVTRQDGIGVAVLLDTTGSMGDSVPDASAGRQPKLQIAKRAVLALLAQADKAAAAAPARNIQVGVYEFSERNQFDDCRRVTSLGPLNLTAARSAVNPLTASGGTPIGNAMIMALQDLGASGLAHRHVLVVTDGENNRGYAPADVLNALAGLPAEDRPAVYFVAFDISADRFRTLRDGGAMVLAASNEPELQQTLDYILTGKILAEQPSPGGAP